MVTNTRRPVAKLYAGRAVLELWQGSLRITHANGRELGVLAGSELDALIDARLEHLGQIRVTVEAQSALLRTVPTVGDCTHGCRDALNEISRITDAG